MVRYNTKKVGNINKSITVTSNATKSRVILKVKGKVNAAAPAATMPGKNLGSSGAPVKNK